MRLKRILFFFVLITVPLFGTETDLEKAIKFRKGEEYAKAERLLKKILLSGWIRCPEIFGEN